MGFDDGVVISKSKFSNALAMHQAVLPHLIELSTTVGVVFAFLDVLTNCRVSKNFS